MLTNDAILDANVRAMRSYGETSRYCHEEIGYNSRLDEVQAALLREACLPRLLGWIKRRREIAAVYNSGIDNPEIGLPGSPENSDSSWHLFPVHVAPHRRDAFLAHLKKSGIAVGVHYPTAIPDQPALSKTTFELADPCTNARQICASEVSIPIHPYLTDDEVSYVIDATNAFARAELCAA